MSTIYLPTDSYQVIMEVARCWKPGTKSAPGIYMRANTGAGAAVAFATVERRRPDPINHVGQLQAVTVSFNLAPGRAGRRDRQDRPIGRNRHAESIITSYGGDAAVFKSSQGNQAILIIAALLVIYVLLGVLYESYIHPLTILAGLPSAAVGAW